MSFKNLLDNTYLQPIVTPLSWAAKVTKGVMTPYIKTAERAKANTSSKHPLEKFLKLKSFSKPRSMIMMAMLLPQAT